MEVCDQEELEPENVELMRVWDLNGKEEVCLSCDHPHKNTPQETRMFHLPEVDNH